MPITSSSMWKELSSITQYKVGNYRVDLYFPQIRLVIECDENNHSGYDQVNEVKRHEYIEKTLNCVIYRYNPDSKDFFIYRLIYEITSIQEMKMFGAISL